MNASWLSAAIGADAANVVLYLVGALVILLGIWLCFLFFRRRKSGALKKFSRRETHRITVRDSVRVDERRRLVLIRRDNMEHLLLTGGESDLVVESFPDLSADKMPQTDREASAKAQNTARPAGLKAEPPAAGNAYTAKPQPLPQTAAGGAAAASLGAERPRDFAREAAALNGNPRDAQPSQTSEARAARPPSDGQYAGARAENRPDEPAYREARRPQPDGSVEAARAADGRERQNPPQDMRAGSRQIREQNFHQNTPAERRQDGMAQPALRPNGAQADSLMPSGQNGRPMQNGQNSAYPHRDESYPPNSAAEAAGRQNGFPPYPLPQEGRQNSAHESPLGGANPYSPERRAQGGQPPMQRAEGANAADRAAALDRPEQIRDRAAQMAASRPIMAESYAPYLGYIPQAAAQHTRGAPANGAAHAAPALGGGAAQQNAMRENGSPSRNAYEDSGSRGGSSRLHDEIMRHHEEQNAQRNSEARAAALQRQQPAFPDHGAQKAGSGFDGAAENGRSSFAAVNPPEENDFDKILQDELLRAPNTIKFPSSQKK